MVFLHWNFLPCLTYYILLSEVSFGTAQKLALFCVNTKGDILLVKDNDQNDGNSANSCRYSFPEIESVGSHYRAPVMRSLPLFGIKGYVGDGILYTGPENRRVNEKRRTRFVRIFVSHLYYYGVVDRRRKVWKSMEECRRLLKNHPNQDYRMFLEFVAEFPDRIRYFQENNYFMPQRFGYEKKYVLICVNSFLQTLFVKNRRGGYILPTEWMTFSSFNPQRASNKISAVRLMTRFGIVGAIRNKLSEKRFDEGHSRKTEYVYYVAVSDLARAGVEDETRPLNEERLGVAEACGKLVSYDFNDRMWFPTEITRGILRSTHFGGIYDELYAFLYRQRMMQLVPSFAGMSLENNYEHPETCIGNEVNSTDKRIKNESDYDGSDDERDEILIFA